MYSFKVLALYSSSSVLYNFYFFGSIFYLNVLTGLVTVFYIFADVNSY